MSSLNVMDTAYLEEAAAWFREHMMSDSLDDLLCRMDVAYARPNPQDYSVVLSEMQTNEWPLFLLVSPDSAAMLVRAADDPARLQEVIPRLVSECGAGLRQREVLSVDIALLDAGRLKKELIAPGLSFEFDDRHADFPLVLLHHRSNERAYMSACADSRLVYSAMLKSAVDIPYIVSQNPDRRAFERSWTFVHELIHVLQRVFRKRKIPTYDYGDPRTGRRECRNLEHRIAVGVEDELEVQAIMARAYPKYDFSLDATMIYISVVKRDWTSRPIDAGCASQAVSTALKMIDFSKYQSFVPGNLEKTVCDAFEQA